MRALVVVALALSMSMAALGCQERDGYEYTVGSTAQIQPEAEPFETPLMSGSLQLADVVEQVVPSVVNLAVTKRSRVPKRQLHDLFDDPFFREFFSPYESIPSERKQRSLGSGVVVSRDGVILTAAHVVKGAEQIEVSTAGGKSYAATIVAIDEPSDVAIVRLTGEVPKLRPIRIGDSSEMRLGDIVLAVGNPFGVGQTVTMGIISGTERSELGIHQHEDFLQTDAAINPGNSGGALVNTRGELIGINNAIVSRTGGYQGIGFAIPTSLAKPIMESLLRDGKVERGWLGVRIQSVDGELADGLDLAVQSGALVAEVMPNGPAARAGLRRGDVIVGVDNRAISAAGQLRNAVSQRKPGTTVTFVVMRGKEKLRLQAQLGSQPQRSTQRAAAQAPEGGGGLLEGVGVAPLDPETRARYEVGASVDRGVVVTRVPRTDVVSRLGLRVGDVIVEVNRRPVSSPREFRRLSEQVEGAVALLVIRKGTTLYLAARK